MDGFGNVVVELGEEEAYKVVDIDLNDIEKVRKGCLIGRYVEMIYMN